MENKLSSYEISRGQPLLSGISYLNLKHDEYLKQGEDDEETRVWVYEEEQE